MNAGTKTSPLSARRLKDGLSCAVTLVVLIWIVELINVILNYKLNALGIVPRTFSGLPGIVLSPLLHASAAHAFFNTFPLLILGFLVAQHSPRSFFPLSLLIALIGGAGVWLIGRHASHVGASGLIFGYFGCILARGLYGKSIFAALLALLVLLLYGSMLWGILPLNPLNPFMSWEGHLCGLIAGVIVGRFHARRPR